jgi:uncharacterized protein YutE (UPF0331/DUF86 family)
MTSPAQSKSANRAARWPFFTVAAASIAVIAARMIWPTLLFDTMSLILLAIAFVALVIPFLEVQKLKWGDFEIELQALVNDLEKNIAATESDTSPEGPQVAPRARRVRRVDSTNTWQQFFASYSDILKSAASNTEKILAAAILIERMLEAVAIDFSLEIKSGRGPRSVVDQLLQHELITREEFQAFHDFWSIRNKIVHGGIEPTDEITARILDLGWRLVRVFA